MPLFETLHSQAFKKSQPGISGRSVQGSLGTGILVPGIVRNERTFNPRSLFHAISLQIPSSLPVPHTKPDISRPLRMDQSEIRHFNIIPLNMCPEAQHHCLCWDLVWGFSCGQAHVFTSSLMLVTLPGVCPVTVTLFDRMPPHKSHTLRARQQLIDTQEQFSHLTRHKVM